MDPVLEAEPGPLPPGAQPVGSLAAGTQEKVAGAFFGWEFWGAGWAEKGDAPGGGPAGLWLFLWFLFGGGNDH